MPCVTRAADGPVHLTAPKAAGGPLWPLQHRVGSGNRPRWAVRLLPANERYDVFHKGFDPSVWATETTSQRLAPVKTTPSGLSLR